MKWSPSILGLIIFIAIFTVGASLLSLINGFPYLYFDSRYYFAIAYDPFNLPEVLWRSPLYGWWLALTARVVGLEATILLQNIWTGLVLASVARWLLPNLSYTRWAITALVLLLTPFSYLGNFMMPDFFTGLLVLTFLVLFKGKPQRLEKGFVIFTFVVSALSHYLNIGLAAALLVAYGRFPFKKTLVVSLVFFAISIGLSFFRSPQSSGLSAAFHHFLYSKIVALELHRVNPKGFCDQGVKLCKEARAHHIWRNNSVMQEDPGLYLEMVAYNQALLTSPWSLVYLGRSLLSILEQMGTYYPVMQILKRDAYAGAILIRLHEPSYRRYFNSRVVTEEGKMDVRWGMFFVGFMAFCFTVLLGTLAIQGFWMWGQSVYQSAFGVFIFAYTFNAASVALLGEPNSRYNYWLIWVLFVIVYLARLDRLWRTQAGPQSHRQP